MLDVASYIHKSVHTTASCDGQCVTCIFLQLGPLSRKSKGSNGCYGDSTIWSAMGILKKVQKFICVNAIAHLKSASTIIPIQKSYLDSYLAAIKPMSFNDNHLDNDSREAVPIFFMSERRFSPQIPSRISYERLGRLRKTSRTLLCHLESISLNHISSTNMLFNVVEFSAYFVFHFSPHCHQLSDSVLKVTSDINMSIECIFVPLKPVKCTMEFHLTYYLVNIIMFKLQHIQTCSNS